MFSRDEDILLFLFVNVLIVCPPSLLAASFHNIVFSAIFDDRIIISTCRLDSEYLYAVDA